jgi:peptidoglycan/LPS O-acetylase OafA/YrhL
MTVARSAAREPMQGVGHGSAEPTYPYGPAPVPAAHGRLHFMDNLRVALTVLIICQHASFAYAPANWWYFNDSQQQPLLASFFIVNRSFRMSLFFLIAGYFMPYVLDRKGAPGYLKDRFRRFGVPILLFLIFVFPLLMYAYYVNFRPYGPIGFWDYYIHIYWGIEGHSPDNWSGPDWPDAQLGHLWFIEMLLVYAVIYVAWRALKHGLNLSWPGPLAFPSVTFLALLMAVVAAITFWVRLRHPVYSWSAFLGVIQLSFADVPRDIACFVLGVLAFRNDWLRRLPSAAGYRWLALGLAGAAIFIAFDLSGNSFFSAGGRSPRAVIYPIWETVTCFGFCLGLPTLFRDHFDFRSPFLDRLSAASYGVYVIHLPIVVLLQYALGSAALPAVAKFLLVAAIAVPLSFLLVMVLRRLPAARPFI